MPGEIQPLVNNQKIVTPDGLPTDYFIRWAQQRQIDITGGITAIEAQQLIDDWAAAREILAGVGLDGGGPLSANVTIDLADTAVTPGVYGDATNVPQITVDQQGRITAVVDIPNVPASVTPVVRGTGIQSSSAGSYNVAFPAGTVAGDRAFIFAAGGWVPSAPAGWTALDAQNGANVNGAVYFKDLVSGDLPGPVVVNFSDVFNSTVAILVIEGTASINQGSYERTALNVASDTLALGGSVLATDLIVSFAHSRSNSTNTVSNGAVLRQVAAASASGVLAAGTVPAGSFTQTFNYGSNSGDGYYEVVLALR